MAKPIVAIVGRPNVGKSTLFNRLAGQRLAIVEDVPGTTRDRLYTDVEWRDRSLTVVDTGGLWPRAEKDLEAQVRLQVEEAIQEADVIVFLVDVTSGLLPDDYYIAEQLRRSEKPVLLVVTKVDNPRRRGDVPLFYELGIGDPIAISAYHGTGIRELLDSVLEGLPDMPEAEEMPETPKVAIVGRPNTGKSSLLNAFLGQERAIVNEKPGTTRDSIDTILTWDGQSLLLIDTAGIRRRGRIEAGVEYYSSLRAFRAIERADVALLVLDASEGATAQDTHIAGYIRDSFKGAVLVVNKWDLVATEHWKEPQNEWEEAIRQRFRFMDYAPILFISAKTRRGIKEILPVTLQVHQERQKRIPTGMLNQMLEKTLAAHPPPSRRGRQLKIHYVTQAETRPPTFVFFVNDRDLVHFSYERHLENRLRDAFGFMGTPIRLVFKARERKDRERS
ncbi:MAG: ribosome biogenesis GTPase Der [Dehalococcoidia bacterium]|nr:ribosome biogenesis GTPase Der [Dehalococcoidia bacterium]